MWRTTVTPLFLLAISRGFNSPPPHHHIHFVPSVSSVSLSASPSKLSPSPKSSKIQTTLNDAYAMATEVRCPFFKRRGADTVDNVAEVLRFLQLRHKTILPPGTLFADESGSVVVGGRPKQKNLPVEEISRILERDFKDKNYYVSGELTESVYRDDCFFDGPDPDMPVVGLRKYLTSTRGLFSPNSRVNLISIGIGLHTTTTPNEETSDEEAFNKEISSSTRERIMARWRGDFVLRLPWRPSIRTMEGTTIYELDGDGLICKHTESWGDMTVWEAFWSVIMSSLRMK